MIVLMENRNEYKLGKYSRKGGVYEKIMSGAAARTGWLKEKAGKKDK